MASLVSHPVRVSTTLCTVLKDYMMSWQYMAVHLKDQICNNFVRGTIQSKHMPAAIIGYSVAYDYYTYGTHVSRVRSVTYTGYGTDPADIPKKGTDPTTS